MQTIRHVQRSRLNTSNDLCTTFCALYISVRGLSTTRVHRAITGTNNATPNPQHSANAESHKRGGISAPKPPNTPASNPDDKLAAARQETKEAMSRDRAKAQEAPKQGGLASNSIFADDFMPVSKEEKKQKRDQDDIDAPLSKRSPEQMAPRLDPNPGARKRWQRKMVIREIRRSGRPTREMLIARTERAHTAKSHFFKTSVKKLAPLARQIAGKSLDEAILQMRFSKKKAAIEVQKHLIQARNEAIVMRGMGISAAQSRQLEKQKREDKTEDTQEQNTEEQNAEAQNTQGQSVQSIQEQIVKVIEQTEPSTTACALAVREKPLESGLTQSSAVFDREGPEITTPAETVPLPTQNPTRSVRKDIQPNQTDIYIAQAWVNRGQYGGGLVHRARGRIDRLRLPYTGISVMLKEEKTRTREKAEKEMKAIKKRLNGRVWTQLPDRPVVRQSQYVLW